MQNKIKIKNPIIEEINRNIAEKEKAEGNKKIPK